MEPGFPIDGACHQFRDHTTASAAPSSSSSSHSGSTHIGEKGNEL